MKPGDNAELEIELWEHAVKEHVYCMQSGLNLIKNDLEAFSNAVRSL